MVFGGAQQFGLICKMLPRPHPSDPPPFPESSGIFLHMGNSSENLKKGTYTKSVIYVVES